MTKKQETSIDKKEKAALQKQASKKTSKKNTDEKEKSIDNPEKTLPEKTNTKAVYNLIKTDENINPIESVKKKPIIKRPYNQKTFENIINDITSGLSIINACKNNNIDYSTVMKWIATDSSLADQLHRARIQRTSMQLESTIDIANDAIRVADGDTRQAVAQVQARKLLIETIYKTASKLCPDEFGDRIRTDIAGIQGSPIGTISITADQLLQIQRAEQEAIEAIKSKLIDD